MSKTRSPGLDRSRLASLTVLLGITLSSGQVYAEQGTGPAAEVPGWLFPVARLDAVLPSWLHLGGSYRNRVELPAGIGRAAVSDSYLLDRLRADVTIQPAAWVGLHAEVQDSRIHFNRHTASSSSYEDKWTLWEGYAQVGQTTQGWVDVLVGRQALRFGDERVIGPSNWLNVGRTFNVGRIDMHHGSYRVSFFAASVVPGDGAELHSVLPANNLYGIYANLQNVVPQATLEPYVLWRLAPSSSALPETLGRGHLNEVTVGLHWYGTLPAGFDYDTEVDWQGGSLGQANIEAGAAFVGVGRRFVHLVATPRIFLEANYASGTKDRMGGRWSTFDQLYPSNHDKFGFADQVGRRNLVQYRVGVEEIPSRGWKLKQAVEEYWLATASDNFYASSGAVSVAAHPGAGRRIGTELDLVAEYQWIKGVSFGFGFARLFAGPFLKSATPGHDYVYPYAYMQYDFSPSSQRAR